MQSRRYVFFYATIATILLTLSLSPAFAESGTSNTATRTAKPELRKEEKLIERQEKMASKATEIKERMDEKRDKLASKTAERKEEMEDRMEKLASKAAERWEDRCEKLNERTTLILTRYENNKTRHIQEYQNAKKRLEDVITKLKAQGADTTKLEADLKQLNTLIEKAASDYAAFIAALKDTKNYACGKSEGAYANALKSSQDKLETARKSLLAVRTYYQSTIRPDIQAVKAQLPKKSPRASAAVTAAPVATSSAQ